MKNSKRQQGLAIVSVLLIVALMSIMISLLIERQHYLTEKMISAKLTDAAFFYAAGAESFVIEQLKLDKDIKSDFLSENWWTEAFSTKLSSDWQNEPLPFISLANQKVTLEISDMQGRYNINNLKTKDGKLQQIQRSIFYNLLTHAGIEKHDKRLQLLDALIDWLDDNTLSTGVFSTESDYYLSLETPYVAADQFIVNVGELFYVRGYNKDIVKKLLPHITALPAKNTKININSATTVVLAALSESPTMNLNTVAAILEVKKRKDFSGLNVENIKDDLISASGIGANVYTQVMSTSSSYYQVNAYISMSEINFKFSSLLFREKARSTNNTTNSLTNQVNPLFNTVTVLRREKLIL